MQAKEMIHMLYTEYGTKTTFKKIKPRDPKNKLVSKVSKEYLSAFLDRIYNDYITTMLEGNELMAKVTKEELIEWILGQQKFPNTLKANKIRSLTLTDEELNKTLSSPYMPSIKLDNAEQIHRKIVEAGLGTLKPEYITRIHTKDELTRTISNLMSVVILGALEILYTVLRKGMTLEDAITIAKEKFIKSLNAPLVEEDTMYFPVSLVSIKYGFAVFQSTVVKKLTPFDAPASAATVMNLYFELGANIKNIQKAYNMHKKLVEDKITKLTVKKRKLDEQKLEAQNAADETNTILTDNIKPFLLNAFTKALMSNPDGITDTDIDEIARTFKEIRTDILNNPNNTTES